MCTPQRAYIHFLLLLLLLHFTFLIHSLQIKLNINCSQSVTFSQNFEQSRFKRISNVENSSATPSREHEIPHTENNFHPISLSNHSKSISPYLFRDDLIIKNHPKIEPSQYFFPEEESTGSDKEQEFLANDGPGNRGATPPLRGKRIKTFIRAFKGSWSTERVAGRGSVEKRIRSNVNFRTICLSGAACRDKSRIFISFLSLPLHWPPHEAPFETFLETFVGLVGPRFPFLESTPSPFFLFLLFLSVLGNNSEEG